MYLLFLLFTGTHNRYEKYIKKRLNVKRVRIDQLIHVSKTIQELATKRLKRGLKRILLVGQTTLLWLKDSSTHKTVFLTTQKNGNSVNRSLEEKKDLERLMKAGGT